MTVEPAFPAQSEPPLPSGVDHPVSDGDPTGPSALVGTDNPVSTDTSVDVDTYDERFDTLAAQSYRVAYRMIGSREEARDLAQEAMARAYARWPKVRGSASAWVSRVTTNLALDVIRRRGRSPRPPDGRPGDLAHHAAERADLVAALRALPRRQRDVVVLRYLADVSEAEVAEVLGCSPGTVKQHAHRGLAALRTSLALSVPTCEPSPEDIA